MLGIHKSTLRAAVADMVSGAHLGTAYGIFTAAYGLAWLVGSTVIGVPYEYSVVATVYFTIATQVVALGLFIPLAAENH